MSKRQSSGQYVCATILLGITLLIGKPVSAQELAFTWDDLPAHSSLPAGQTRVEIMDAIVGAMRTKGLPPAYGFVNGVRIRAEPASAAALNHWRASGNLLGNHAWSHMNLNDHTAAEFEADLVKNEPLLQRLSGASEWHWLRFPYLAEGNDPAKRSEVRGYLLAHGYKVAPVTMSFGDYAWNEPYARCVAKDDQAAIAALEVSYLAAADDAITVSRSMAKSVTGHDVPYVLLMHVGALDARMLPRLLDLYARRGFRFVTLEKATADPFYKSDVDLSAPDHATSLEGAMAERHLPLPARSPLPDFATTCR